MSVPLPFPTKKTLAIPPSVTLQYLTADERFEIFLVKAAERPHYLAQHCESNNSSEEEVVEKALIDGCDIPQWRSEKLYPLTENEESILNIGAGSGFRYFKLDRQWACFLNKTSWWSQFQSKLLHYSLETAKSISYESACCIINKDKNQTRFQVQFEQGNFPAKILDVTTDWQAIKSWTFDNFDKRFKDIKFRFSDLHGEMLEFHTYKKYIYNLEGKSDDSPLAIYDSEFGNDESTKELLKEYTIPKCFGENLFELVDQTISRIPPFRWILIGPERSGTGLHVDPLYTNAWVTVLEGCKYWILFPPYISNDEIYFQDPAIPSSIWFYHYFNESFTKKGVHVLQKRGETVFVPQGWKHIVLNLDLTVAVTHNYASEFGDLERIWEEVQSDEEEFGREWCLQLKRKRPDLAKRLNMI